MNVFVSSKLDYIKQELKNRGYDVLTNSNSPCDAIICDLKTEGIMGFSSDCAFKNSGTLIIDSGGKNIDEIEKILINKVYSSLF